MSMNARKTAQKCEAAKGQYASQLVKTNDSQKKYVSSVTVLGFPEIKYVKKKKSNDRLRDPAL